MKIRKIDKLDTPSFNLGCQDGKEMSAEPDKFQNLKQEGNVRKAVLHSHMTLILQQHHLKASHFTEARVRAGDPHFHAGDPTGTVAWLI
jgi:hypothetical protein